MSEDKEFLARVIVDLDRLQQMLRGSGLTVSDLFTYLSFKELQKIKELLDY